MAFHNDFRPKKFADIYGQDHITRVLLNAGRTGRLNEYQALLFIGTRGTGKTTLARILAHRVNCSDPQNGEPCMVCNNCKTVSDCIGRGSGDVVELDAASSGGIDDVHKIIDACRYQSMSTLPKKVFIIDEAHQLSAPAKDALLKTLEEPPAHVMFILATTEAHRIPPTIGSRCKKFSFREGDVPSITAYLKKVLDERGTTYEDQALQRIAMVSSGSYREAVGMIELLADSAPSVTAAALDDVLCLPDMKVILDTARAVASGDQAQCITIINSAVMDGKDVRLFLREVVSTLIRMGINMAKRGVAKTPEGLTITHLMDIGTFIYNRAAACPGELAGLLPGLILAGAASMATELRNSG